MNQAIPTMHPAASTIFRRATVRDIPAMTAIRLAVRENILSDPARVTEQMYIDYLELRGRGWVAEIDGVVAGFSYANNEDGSIWALFVAPHFDGSGLGKRLLRLAADWLFEQGHETVRLSTGINTRADRFYAAQGWSRQVDGGNEASFTISRPAPTMSNSPDELHSADELVPTLEQMLARYDPEKFNGEVLADLPVGREIIK